MAAHTPARSVRIPDDLWKATKTAAAADGRTATDVVTERLERYVRARAQAGATPKDGTRTRVTLDFDIDNRELDPAEFLHAVAHAVAAADVLAPSDVVRLLGSDKAVMVESVPMVLGFKTT